MQTLFKKSQKTLSNRSINFYFLNFAYHISVSNFKSNIFKYRFKNNSSIEKCKKSRSDNKILLTLTFEYTGCPGIK